MRASATSRIASPAPTAAAQSKADANKADETSPFALLVGQVQAKPATQQKDRQGKDSSDDKQGDEGTASQAGNTNASAQTAAQAAVAQAAAKPVKADKGDDKKKDDDSSNTPDGSAATAALQQASAQPQPPAQVALTAANAAITTANDDASDDEPGVTAAGAVGVAASGQAKTQAGQNFQSAQAADQAAPADQADGQTNSQTTGQTTNQTSGQPSGPSGNAQAQAAAATQNMAQQSAAQQNGIQPDGVQAPTKPWQAKTQNAGGTSNTKTDSSQASDAKAADVKQTATPAPQAVAANDVPVAKPADATTSVMPAIAGSQGQTQQAQGSDAPSITQNVQVSTPTPNMPALAVEIAARSQSGAKQFDIRLDPPELGRVEVRLSIDATGKASAHLSADQPQTLDLLQKDAPTLTRALRDAGLDVSQDGLNFSLRQQPGDAGTGNQSRGGNGRSFTLTATTSTDATSASAAYRAPADGRLDIRV